MQRNLASGRQLLVRNVPIFLHGATGTGKNFFARTLHDQGPWADRPFVTVNCAAIPTHILDPNPPGGPASAGAQGRGEPVVDATPVLGTLFVDEPGDLSAAEQVRLLRLIEAHRHRAARHQSSSGRGCWQVISASLHDLAQMVATGEFRADLYYRLAGATLELPALNVRADRDDLIDALLHEESINGGAINISAGARQLLAREDWPGNVRQLRNVLRAAAALCRDRIIRRCDLPPAMVERDVRDVRGVPPGSTSMPTMTVASALQDAEHDALSGVLSQFDWNIARAARALAVSRNTLYRKLRKHGITPPEPG